MPVKHPFFEYLGDNYPYALEEHFDRILIMIEQLWKTPEIHDYFSGLIIDSRGGRRGFPKDVMEDILRLRKVRHSDYIREAEGIDSAINELGRLGFERSNEQLLQAIHEDNRAVVDLFVRSNFNIHISDHDGTPILLMALKKGYTVIAGILISKGADVNAHDRMGVTPLLLVCGKQLPGYKTIAEMLIERGADIFARGKNRKSALALAESSGNTHIAELLKAKGATD